MFSDKNASKNAIYLDGTNVISNWLYPIWCNSIFYSKVYKL